MNAQVSCEKEIHIQFLYGQSVAYGTYCLTSPSLRNIWLAGFAFKEVEEEAYNCHALHTKMFISVFKKKRENTTIQFSCNPCNHSSKICCFAFFFSLSC